MTTWSGGRHCPAGVVQAFEARHGIRLPEAYRDIVLKHDGGRPDPGSVPWDGPGGSVRLGGLIPFEHPDPSFSIEGVLARRPYGIPEHVVPFGMEGGGYLFVFWFEKDLREDPPIGVFRHDVPGGELVPIAADFNDFLEALGDYGLTAAQDPRPGA